MNEDLPPHGNIKIYLLCYILLVRWGCGVVVNDVRWGCRVVVNDVRWGYGVVVND